MIMEGRFYWLGNPRDILSPLMMDATLIYLAVSLLLLSSIPL
jgi:hypothetical protein